MTITLQYKDKKREVQSNYYKDAFNGNMYMMFGFVLGGIILGSYILNTFEKSNVLNNDVYRLVYGSVILFIIISLFLVGRIARNNYRNNKLNLTLLFDENTPQLLLPHNDIRNIKNITAYERSYYGGRGGLSFTYFLLDIETNAKPFGINVSSQALLYIKEFIDKNNVEIPFVVKHKNPGIMNDFF